jgi:membrane-associated phospholipid phosphatase
MSVLHDVYTHHDRPVGRTTLNRLFVASAVFLFVMTVFGFIAREVIEGETLPEDRSILLFINHFASPPLDLWMIGITSLGNIASIIALTTAIVILLIYRKRWQALTQVLFGISGALLLNIILKVIFARDRPHLWTWVITESTYSFPSGHAMLTATLALTCIFIAWHTKWRWWVVSVGTLYVLAVGFSRLYLGVHYPTDVLAGWIVALGWVVAVATFLGAIKWPVKKH